MLANPSICLKSLKERRLGNGSATNVLRNLVPRENDLVLSKEEEALAEQIAKRKGITREQAAELVLKASIARRVKKRTGKTPAKVYPIKGRKP